MEILQIFSDDLSHFIDEYILDELESKNSCENDTTFLANIVHTRMENRMNQILTPPNVSSMVPQSSNEVITESDTVENSGISKEVLTIAESDDGDSSSKTMITDTVTTSIFTDEYGIAKFLSRPALIATNTIALGAAFSTIEIDPWFLFFTNAAIRKKVDNYAFIQCSLHIKVVVKASPFIYGQFALTYHPLTGIASHQSFGGTDALIRTPLSQRMSLCLEPHKNRGGEMVLPFFHYKNWLELTSSDALGAMGRLQLWDYAPLQSANGGTSAGATFNIYAWAEDVKLAGPTNTLVAQSGTTTEYGQGPVSRVASTVADISSSLEDMPVIGLFAKATSIGARAISGIASLFGFTKVPVIEDVRPFKDLPFHGFSNSEIGTPLEKLTLDPKNELCVDPRTVGLEPVDELSIDHIARRSSFLTYYDWTQSMNKGDYFFGANVGPTLHTYANVTSAKKIYMPPMCMLSTMFSNWRGEIVVTIKIVRSQYHQGALQICYDPVGNPFNNNDDSSTIQTKVIDIAEADEVEFRIPWTQPQSFLRVDPNMADVPGTSHTGFSSTLNTAPLNYDADYHNGRFVIKVFNPLTAPDGTSNVRVLTFIRAEQLNFQNPSDLTNSISDFVPQSKTETITENSIVKYTMGTSVPIPDRVFNVNFGEVFYSLRPLLRRTCKIFSEPVTPGSIIDQAQFSYLLTKYPPSYGYDPNGRFMANNQAATLAVKFNYCRSIPFSIIAPCFVGQRGSMDWHFNLNGQISGQKFMVTRHNDYTSNALRYRRQMPTANDGEVAQFYFQQDGAGLTGMSLINRQTQTGLAVAMPQFNKFRFVSTDPNYYVSGRDVDDTENEKMLISFNTDDADVQSRTTLDAYSNIGVDYTLFYFLNVPVRYIYTNQEPNGNSLVWS